MRRRKGIRQRQSRPAKPEEEQHQESSLYNWLLTNLAWGEISGPQCVSIAAAAVADLDVVAPGQFRQLRALAVGSGNASNSWRTSQRQLIAASDLPMPYKVRVPYTTGDHLTSILLPHEFFSAVYKDSELWRTTFLPDKGALEKLWGGLVGHPMLHQHPVLRREGYQSLCVPLGMHGDEVPVTGVGKVWARQVLSISFFSLVAAAVQGCTLDIMLYVWGVMEKFCKTDKPRVPGTMTVFWTIMAWSFNAIWTGKWPDSDWRGVRLPGLRWCGSVQLCYRFTSYVWLMHL